jgi:hypothetical protein
VSTVPPVRTPRVRASRACVDAAGLLGELGRRGLSRVLERRGASARNTNE